MVENLQSHDPFVSYTSISILYQAAIHSKQAGQTILQFVCSKCGTATLHKHVPLNMLQLVSQLIKQDEMELDYDSCLPSLIKQQLHTKVQISELNWKYYFAMLLVVKRYANKCSNSVALWMQSFVEVLNVDVFDIIF